jgi:hypothetical protein
MVAEFIKSVLPQEPTQIHEGNNVSQLVLRQTALLKQALQWLVEYSQERSHLDNYALPGYFLITGRKGLYLVNNHNGYFPVCHHPNLSERLLIFPPVGNANSISNYLHTLDPWPRNGVQLARIPIKEQESIVCMLRKEWDITHSKESILDWGMYPVRSLQVKEMALREGTQFKNHRRKYNYVSKRVEKLEIIENWDSEKDKKFEKFIYSWAQKKHARDRGFSLDDYISPYLKIISIHSNPNIRSVCLLFENSLDEIIGTVIVEVANGVASAYMNIATDEIPYFPAYILMRTCEFLYNKKLAKVLCLGGSEHEGLDKFKSDLQPSAARTDKRFSYYLNSFLVKPLPARRLYT